MWIRSQGKEVLIDVKNVYIRSGEGDSHKIITSLDNYDAFVLATYKKREVAIEVLDEIERRIVQSYLRKRHKPTRCLANAEDVIFEMPKDVPTDVVKEN